MVSLSHSACAQDRLIRIVQNPSFGAAHMKLLYPVFLDKAYKVRPLLAAVSIVPNSKECTPSFVTHSCTQSPTRIRLQP